MAKKKSENEVKEVRFTKNQILYSKKYTNIQKDILKTLLKSETYSLSEVNKILEDFKKKEVK